MKGREPEVFISLKIRLYFVIIKAIDILVEKLVNKKI